MDLLYVTEQVPNRDPVEGNGSSMIPYEVILALPEEVRVTLLTYDDGFPVPAEIAARCAEVVLLPLATVRSGRRGLLRTVWSAASPATRERLTAGARRAVAAHSARLDVTLVHGGRIAQLAGAVHGPVVIQTVDPWSSVVTMEAQVVSGWRAAYRRLKAWQALWLERRLPVRARLLTVGAADAAVWSARLGREVHAIANGVHLRPRPVPTSTDRPTVCFVGDLSYLPNMESVEILVREIAPLVWREVPEARFLVAGRNPEASVLALAGDRVEVRANVASVDDVFLGSTVAAFPDRNGVGVRNSVTECLAAGTPVVATGAAAREQAEHPLLTVTDDTDGFVAAVVAGLRQWPSARPEPAASPLRGWSDAVGDYLQECEAAAP